MAGGFVPRFVVELVFLALLAVGAGQADLGTALIVVVMCVGWLLVTVIEWLAWREEMRGRRRTFTAAPRIEPEQEPAPEESTAWDIQEILAPLPEDGVAREPVVEPLTTVLPATKVGAGRSAVEPASARHRWLLRPRRPREGR